MSYNENSLVGTRWRLIQFGVALENSEIEFRSHGNLYDTDTPSSPTYWNIANNTITLNYNNGYAIYTGTISNDLITGTAVNKVGKKWTFKADRIIKGQSLVSESDSKKGRIILPTEMQKAEFTYYYYFAYYPTRFQVSEELRTVRQIVFRFKDGKTSSKIAISFSEDIDCLNLDGPISSWWLCIIPASTKEKTELRFKTFCEKYCELTKINNGYSLIINKADRNAIHLQEDRGSVNILDSIDFANVKGKSILLFDDIYTTGKSFLKVARRLKALGAIDVIGLFLGKTHWIEEESVSIEDIEEI